MSKISKHKQTKWCIQSFVGQVMNGNSFEIRMLFILEERIGPSQNPIWRKDLLLDCVTFRYVIRLSLPDLFSRRQQNRLYITKVQKTDYFVSYGTKRDLPR